MKRIASVLILPALIICVFLTTHARAENRSGALTLSPSAGGYLFEGDQDFERRSRPTYGLGIGYNITERWGIEALFNFVADAERIDTTGTKHDVDGFVYRLEGLYHFMPENRLVPYLALGVGDITLDSDPGRSESTFAAGYGAGLKYFLSENVALRLDARHLIAFDQGIDESEQTDNNFLYTGGLVFLIGGEKPAPAAAPTPRDTDGDGVTDDRDKCPKTPKGVAVDKAGCPLDDDKDGVADYLDKCPKTPKGAPVDATGCPLDSDGDGIFDYLDECPGTPKGVMVDDVGCTLKFTLYIEFDFDKADIRPEYFGDLANAAEFIEKYPAPKILVAGHTDNIGEDDYNMELSQRRANAVRQYLIDNYSLDPGKLVAKGYGETQPVADNNTEEGRQMNRRVEIVCCVVIPD